MAAPACPAPVDSVDAALLGDTDVARAYHHRGIALGASEVVVREYHATESVLGFFFRLFAGEEAAKRRHGGDGYLVATTARLILIGEGWRRGRHGRWVREVQVDQVSGLSCYLTTGWMTAWALLRLIAGLIAGVLITYGLSRLSSFFWLLLLPVFGWFISAIALRGQRIVLAVHAKAVNPSPVVISGQQSLGAFGWIRNRVAGGVSEGTALETLDVSARPGRDADALVNELGALVGDIQTDTALSLERWSGGQPPETTRQMAVRQATA